MNLSKMRRNMNGRKVHPDKLAFSEKATYATGAISDVIMANIVFQLANPVYVDGLKVNPVLIGLAVSIPRLWDAFTDPFMGNLSDNTRLRWGRRKPFMFFGSLLAGLFCAALWMPPTQIGSYGMFLYFLIISILFFTAYTIYSVPFNALGYELTPDYDERTSVMSYKTFMMNLGSTLLLPWALKLCLLPMFDGDVVRGARYVGSVFGVLIFVAALVPVFLCREKPQTQPRIQLWNALKLTFSNRNFLLVNGMVLFTLTGVFLAFPLLYFLNRVYICKGDLDVTATLTGWYGTVYGASGILFVPVINYAGQQLGKRKALLLGLATITLGFLASWWLFTPSLPYLQLVFAVLASPGLSCVFILTSSMIADVCDVDELNTGLRREGMYGAAFGFLVKLGIAGVLALSGFILNGAGYDANLETQSPQTVLKLRLFFVGLPIGLLLTSGALAYVFPLTRETMHEVRRKIEEKKQLQSIKTDSLGTTETP